MSDSGPTSGAPRAMLLALAAGFVAFGVAFLLSPAKLGSMAELSTTGKLGLIELRAFYGGLQVGLGLFLAVAAMRRDWQLPGLLCALLVLLGAAAARIYGMTVEGWPGPMVLLWLALELGGVVAAGFGLMRVKQMGAPEPEAALAPEKTQLLDKTRPLERTVKIEQRKS